MSRGYVERGGSWGPARTVAGLLAVLVAGELVLAGPRVPSLAWVVVAGAFAAALGHTVLARRARTVRVDPAGSGAALSVGRERVPLADVDAAHLRAVRAGRAGVDAGAPVLGGGWSVPRGRSGLPLRLTDGRTVLVPTRDPAALGAALLGSVPGSGTSQVPDPHVPDGEPRGRGTLGP